MIDTWNYIKVRLSPKNLYRIPLIALIILLLSVVMAEYLPYGIDWDLTYRPATLDVFSGRNPYSDDSIFYSPPWAAIPLAPFAILNLELGRSALFIIAFMSYAWLATQLGGKPFSVGLFLISPPVLHGLLNANIDWLVLLGVLLPPRWGLFFISIKPQLAVGVGVWWLFEAWHTGGVKQVVSTFYPVTLGLLASLLVYGLWPLNGLIAPHYTFNASLFPYSVPFGLALLAWAIRTHQIKPALGASPMLSPYVLFHSWAGALVTLVTRPRVMLFIVVSLWFLVLFEA